MKTIRRWDFRDTELLSDKQKALFLRVHEVYLKTFESILAPMFGAKITSGVTKCDQVKYEKFNSPTKQFTVLLEESVTIQMKEYRIVLDIDALFYAMAINKLLGGTINNSKPIGKITEIEETMLTKKFNEMFHLLFKELKNKTVFIHSYLEASSLCDNLNSNGMAVDIKITINDIITVIKIFYPADFIQNVII
jgi:flagellar motor switch protein FliM